jgi:hypothetical protein
MHTTGYTIIYYERLRREDEETQEMLKESAAWLMELRVLQPNSDIK